MADTLYIQSRLAKKSAGHSPAKDNDASSLESETKSDCEEHLNALELKHSPDKTKGCFAEFAQSFEHHLTTNEQEENLP